MRHLPTRGAIDAQDHWLLQALRYCQREVNLLMAQRPRPESDEDELQRFHTERQVH